MTGAPRTQLSNDGGSSNAGDDDDPSEDDRPRRGFFSSALDLNNDGDVSVEEIATNFVSVFLSWVDWSLHLAFAVWLYYDYPLTLYSDLSIAALVLAVCANLLAIVRYILRNTSDPDSSLRDRLMDYPENSTVVLILGLINVELLIFLSEELEDHKNFRTLGLLTNLCEGVPMLAIQIAFVRNELEDWHPLVVISFTFTLFTLILKSLRAWIIVHTRKIQDDEPELLIGENLTTEDHLSIGAAMAAFGLALAQTVWLQYASTEPGIAGTPLGAELESYFAVEVLSLCALGAGNFLLLTRYLRRPNWASSLLWREAFRSACISFAGLFHGTAFNGFTQDDRQYSEVKRDATLVWLLLFAVPTLTVQLLVAVSLDCAHHACDRVVLDLPASVFSMAPVCVLAPCALYNVCRLVVSQAAALGAAEEDGIYLYDDEDVQLVSEPIETDERLPVILSVWLSLVDVALHLSAGAYLLTQHQIGVASGAPGAAYEGMDLFADGLLAPVEFEPFAAAQTPVAFAWIAFGSCGIAAACNLAAASAYLLRSPSQSLKATLFQLPGTASLVLCVGCSNAEALAVLARERTDVDSFRVLSIVGLFLEDLPMLGLLATRAGYWEASPVVLTSLLVTTITLALKAARAIVVGLARAHATSPHPLNRAFFGTIRRGDALSWTVTSAHWVVVLLAAAALSIHTEPWRAPLPLPLGLASTDVCFNASVALTVFVVAGAAANLCVSASYLNHRKFTHGHVSKHSYASGLITLTSLVDASTLNCLAQDRVAHQSVKRDALVAYLAFVGIPSLVLFATLRYMVGSDLGEAIASTSRTTPETVAPGILDAALALSAAVVAWKLYLWTVLTVTWRAGGGPDSQLLLSADEDAAHEARADDEAERGARRDGRRRSRGGRGGGIVRPFRHALPGTRQWRFNRYGDADRVRRDSAASDSNNSGKSGRSDRAAQPAEEPETRAARQRTQEDGLVEGGGGDGDEAVEARAGGDGNVITNGEFAHPTTYPERSARAAQGTTLAGWRQGEGDGAIMGPGDVRAPGGANAWRIATGRRLGARASVSHTFPTDVGTRYALELSLAGTDADPPGARKASVTVHAGGFEAMRAGAEPAASAAADVTNSTVEKHQWHTRTMEFLATADEATLTVRAQAPATAIYIANVSCVPMGGPPPPPRAMPGRLNLSALGGAAGAAGADGRARRPTEAAAVRATVETMADPEAAAAASPQPQPPSTGSGGGGGFFEGLTSMFGAITPRSNAQRQAPAKAADPAPPALDDDAPTEDEGDGSAKVGGRPPSPRSMFGMDAGSSNRSNRSNPPGSAKKTGEQEAPEPARATHERATVEAADDLAVSTANITRRSPGGTPPYFFLPAQGVAEESQVRARQRALQGQPPMRVVSYDVRAAQGLTPDQVERGASREPAAAWKALNDYTRRVADSRVA